MSTRSLENQLCYAINQAMKTGVSKRADKRSGAYQKQNIYSNARYRELRSLSKQFARWYRDKRGGWNILIEAVTAQDWQAFIEYKQIDERAWSIRTTRERISAIGKLQEIVNRAYYSANVDWSDVRALPVRVGKCKDTAMDPEDVALLTGAMGSIRSGARHAVEITWRAGLRADEVAHLRGSAVDLTGQVLVVREGAKNNRYREVPIRDKDFPFFYRLHCMYGEGYVCGGIKSETIDGRIRKAMKELMAADGTGRTLAEKYPFETLHSVRKAYARARMSEETDKGLTRSRAWDVVCRELGHGNDRSDLFDVYAGTEPATAAPMRK